MCFHLVFSFCVDLLGMVKIIQNEGKLQKDGKSMHSHASRITPPTCSRNAGQQRARMRAQREEAAACGAEAAQACVGMRASAGEMREQRASRGRMRKSTLASAGTPKCLRKKKIWADEGIREPKGKKSEEHRHSPANHVQSDVENSYLSIQEESGQVINRGIVSKDLSFKLI